MRPVLIAKHDIEEARNLYGENVPATSSLSYELSELKVVTGHDYRSRFQELSKVWHNDTDAASSVHEKITHDAYLKIIGMGQVAVPLMLQEMKNGSVHWFVALRAVTGEDPVPQNCTNMQKAVHAWLDWGIANNRIFDDEN